MSLESLFSVTNLHQRFPGCLTLGFWWKLIFLKNSNTLLRSHCLKALLCNNKWFMKLCPSIVISAMFLVILTSSAPKLLLLPRLPWLQQFKTLKGMFLVDWVLVLLHSPLLLCLSCKTSPKIRTYQLLKGLSGLLDWVLSLPLSPLLLCRSCKTRTYQLPHRLSGQQLILFLLLTGLQWYLDANPVSKTRGRP